VSGETLTYDTFDLGQGLHPGLDVLPVVPRFLAESLDLLELSCEGAVPVVVDSVDQLALEPVEAISPCLLISIDQSHHVLEYAFHANCKCIDRVGVLCVKILSELLVDLFGLFVLHQVYMSIIKFKPTYGQSLQVSYSQSDSNRTR
jgi:hypothetical protein